MTEGNPVEPLKVHTHATASGLTSMSDCTAQDLIPKMWPDLAFEATWYLLGTAFHGAVEYVIAAESDLDDMVGFAEADMEHYVSQVGGWDNVQDPYSTRKRRDKTTIHDDLRTACVLWWHTVHPAGERRDPVYDGLNWPPRTEVKITADMLTQAAQSAFHAKPDTEKERMRGPRPAGERWLSCYVDALFTRKTDGSPYVVDWKTSGSASASISQLQFYWYALRVGDGVGGEAVAKAPNDVSEIGHFQYVLLNGRKKGDPHSAKIVQGGSYWGDKKMFLMADRSVGRKRLDVRVGPIPETGWQCGYCAARPMCPVYGGSSWSDFYDRADRLIPVRSRKESNGQ